MKKQRLQIDPEFDFEVFGIVSTFKDFKLAWNINKDLHVSLKREKDITIRFVDSNLVVSHFAFSTEGSQLQLIRNKSYELSGGENQFLIPEMSNIDYFILIQGEINGLSTEEVNAVIRNINGVEFTMKVNIEDLKSRENFIF